MSGGVLSNYKWGAVKIIQIQYFLFPCKLKRHLTVSADEIFSTFQNSSTFLCKSERHLDVSIQKKSNPNNFPVNENTVSKNHFTF